ncbi:hypothetical protein HOU40_gp031 [Lactobacillus phage Bromius]|uniref:Baseplate protein n=1 Tax=Lactobacillus phage Bromius TaxID=2315485 RepID=A0A3S7UPN9_9CAUD|nr:hypothetical protein HOU40_gp031 [Lactobacillus phage Bromius]AYH92267.1 hypothetical protein [Lactobacillus phage Bromius]
MSLLSFLHPLWKRSLNEYDDSVNSAVIGALNQSLSKSEEDMVQSKVESYLSTADAKWLDYWGYWFGERRKSGWSDDYYRSRIVNHVEHARGTVDALRDAIADFINTNKDNIYIYEPYRDMFIWNSSKYNTNKYFSSTYYRYAVIDIQISASYPKEIVSIINLFRPAGVLWVLTETVNSRNSDAPIIDIKNPKDAFVPKIENDFMFGLRKRTRLVINPSNDKYDSVNNPFTYNKKDSLFNNRNSLFMGATQTSKRYSFVGQPLFDYTPNDNDTLEYSSYNVEQLSNSDITSVSTKNGRGKTFDFNPAKNNLISNASQYINGVKLNSNTGNPNLLTGTSGTLQTVTNAYNWSGNLPMYTPVVTKVDNDTTYTASAWLSPASHNVRVEIVWKDSSGSQHYSFGNTITAGASGYSVGTVTIPAGGTIQFVTMPFDVSQPTASSVSYKEVKLEKSIFATPYSPAPSEQTTSQSGSLAIPITNVNPDCAYSFSVVSMSDKDSSNANLSLILKDKLGNDITSNITTSISSGKHILRINQNTSASFSSNGYAVISFSGISNTDNISIRLMCLKLSKSLDVPNLNLNTNLMSWAQSADEETNTPTKLADVIDLKGFINDNYKTLGTTVTNKELNDLFDTKKLHLVIRTVNATSDSLTIRFFNFNTNLWVTYGKFDIAGSYTDIFVNLDDITPLMNAKSLMYVSIEFSNDRSISVNLDYIGLSLSNSEDGYSVKMFADQSPYGIESQSVMGPFTISKSSVSRAYISPSE